MVNVRARRIDLAVAARVGDVQPPARVGQATVVEEGRVGDAAEVAEVDVVASRAGVDLGAAASIPRGRAARLADAALEVADHADVALLNDVEVVALDQVLAEVAREEQREAPAGGRPATQDSVAPGLGVARLLLDA